jgi:hypothetical protein
MPHSSGLASNSEELAMGISLPKGPWTTQKQMLTSGGLDTPANLHSATTQWFRNSWEILLGPAVCLLKQNQGTCLE